MVLLADSGSTKCDWVLLDASGNVLLKTITSGLNPAILSKKELQFIIQSNDKLQQAFKLKTTINFFGAGCGTKAAKELLRKALSELFTEATITIEEDMLAAVYSVTTQPAIVCILGTGSNSCYFDGNKIASTTVSLGYTIMDEASGNYYGKQLLRDYFYKKMPLVIAEKFETTYNLAPDIIKTHLYKKPNPNAYLASFAKFIFNTKDEDAYFYNLLNVGISKFIKNHILCYEASQEVPIHFVGSIAYFSETIIKDLFKKHNLELGNIIQKPIDGLVAYYKNHKLK